MKPREEIGEYSFKVNYNIIKQALNKNYISFCIRLEMFSMCTFSFVINNNYFVPHFILLSLNLC